MVEDRADAEVTAGRYEVRVPGASGGTVFPRTLRGYKDAVDAAVLAGYAHGKTAHIRVRDEAGAERVIRTFDPVTGGWAGHGA